MAGGDSTTHAVLQRLLDAFNRHDLDADHGAVRRKGNAGRSSPDHIPGVSAFSVRRTCVRGLLAASVDAHEVPVVAVVNVRPL